MALPGTYLDRPHGPLRLYGIQLGMYPSSDASFDVELQRAQGSSTGSFVQVARLNPDDGQSALFYTDFLPNDNVTRCYRARHIRPGYANGAYTNIAKAKAVELVATNLLGRNTPKDYLIPYNAFTVNQSTTLAGKISFGSGFAYNSLAVGVGADRRAAFCPVILPRGIRLTGLSVDRFYEGTVGGAPCNIVELRRHTSTGTPTIADIDSESSGNQVLSTSIAYSPTTGESLSVSITLGGTLATGSAVRSVTISYRNPLGIPQLI